eukprot:4678873-Pleurochrysis_carterae.AAC.1
MGKGTKRVAQYHKRASQRRSAGVLHPLDCVLLTTMEGIAASGCLCTLNIGSWASDGRGWADIGQ